MRVRFPDSEIRGSEGARPYSRLIAACYVLHRLCAPRHPPDALALTLDRSAFVPCPEKRPGSRTIRRLSFRGDPFLEWYYAIRLSVLWINRLCVRLTPPSHVKDFGSGHCPKPNCVSVEKSESLRAWACHPSCEAAKDGGADRDRTDDLKLAKLPLSQLSYGPGNRQVVGPGRVERPTSRLSGVRSNHLSYEPLCACTYLRVGGCKSTAGKSQML